MGWPTVILGPIAQQERFGRAGGRASRLTLGLPATAASLAEHLAPNVSSESVGCPTLRNVLRLESPLSVWPTAGGWPGYRLSQRLHLGM